MSKPDNHRVLICSLDIGKPGKPTLHWDIHAVRNFGVVCSGYATNGHPMDIARQLTHSKLTGYVISGPDWMNEQLSQVNKANIEEVAEAISIHLLTEYHKHRASWKAQGLLTI